MVPKPFQCSLGLAVVLLLVPQIFAHLYEIDETRTFEEIVIDRGYVLQQHQVNTSDGYILTLFRVVTRDFVDETYNQDRKPKPRPGSTCTLPRIRLPNYLHDLTMEVLAKTWKPTVRRTSPIFHWETFLRMQRSY